MRKKYSLQQSAFHFSRKRFAAWLVLATIVCFGLWQPPVFLQRLEFMVQDALAVKKASYAEQAQPATVMIIAGERSLQVLGHWPWVRSTHADLLVHLEQAQTVVFDLIMPEASLPEEDARFAHAAQEHGRVAIAMHLAPSTDGTFSSLLPIFPYRQLLEACAGIGVVNTVPDIDGVVRTSHLFWRSGELTLPSLSLAAVQISVNESPSIVSEQGQHLLHWSASAQKSKPKSIPQPANLLLYSNNSVRLAPCLPQQAQVYEYVDVLQGKVPAEAFAGRIVLVGVSGGGISDVHRMVGGDFVPGLWLIAQSIEGLLHGNAIYTANPLLLFPFLLCLFVCCALAGACFSLRKGALGAFALLAGWGAIWGLSYWYMAYMIPLVLPLGGGVLLFSAGVCWNLFGFEQEWSVRALPLEEVLALPKQKGTRDFTEYLMQTWPRIQSMCEMHLLEARGKADSPNVLLCLGAQQEKIESVKHAEKATTSSDVLFIFNCAKPPLCHRMLVPLPFSGEQTYTVAAWGGNRNPETLKSISALIVAIAIHYTAIEEQAQRQNMLLSTIRALTGAIDAKDPVTAGHSERVAVLARDIAIWLGWDEQAVEDIFLAGILHDVGKIGVPDNVLNKPGKLDAEEFMAMQSHPAKGAAIMAPIALPEGVELGILEHHERLDGKGYPNGLDETTISWAARVLKVADVYDALISKRQYKEPWSVEKACDLLYSQRGVEFDATVVDAFLQHMAPVGWVPSPEK